MSEPFVGEIDIFGFNFAPRGWAFCNGQVMPISQNTALFSLLGTFYGGDGISTFALPNLQGSVPVHQGQGSGLSDIFQGQSGGEETVTLITSELPQHSHTAACNNSQADSVTPGGEEWAPEVAGSNAYSSTAGSVMSPTALASAGGGQPHNNLQPYLVLNFCIALLGIFPARS